MILALDDNSASVRFHVRRAGEEWLSEDLDGYDEPVLVLDHRQYQPYSVVCHPFPNRADIEGRWRAIIDGTLSREEVHRWSEPLMLGEEELDPLVNTALQYLHGFDLVVDSTDDQIEAKRWTGTDALDRLDSGRLRHGGHGAYLRSSEEVATELERWLSSCVEYDADPRGYIRRARERGEQAARKEQGL